ncbi:bifunctional adenosylcobinamide kinase/adenosylcobinamide-phosphate guanylyltransferase [Thermoanaerobacterium sp. RBIITD]|uniref:bifunctional adenosylcobinamide kinase/adenosylcobinamide-phosphate guanylyltransferase n=1 Tax=Thermoanaerobacterium sp. RBIITD TaxID=1550240 RepID=UPI000BB6DB18|nr:bifunctional adenosylcobinamide kinase/adenosylcobinamide-phosphate guanylyltransferase [Thermoanaerobacterium sp. RBIITD]SNX53219.1 adenosylcobinamide kinase /adenosylcobinamide-phosphate guanylyltransferase [Thermoanaerobacterium sp. RBIITD]
MPIIMVTGGARSGKSELAEDIALKKGVHSVLYIATSIPFDDEMKDRVKRHRERRPSEWETVEAYKGIHDIIAKSDKKVILLDCLTIMISNHLLEVDMAWDNMSIDDIDDIERKVGIEVDKMIDSAKSYNGDVIIVTNEIGMGLVPEYKLGRIFRDIAGRMNKKVASAADIVYFMVSGIPLKIKG